jgi:hypothetical protein
MPRGQESSPTSGDETGNCGRSDIVVHTVSAATNEDGLRLSVASGELHRVLATTVATPTGPREITLRR